MNEIIYLHTIYEGQSDTFLHLTIPYSHSQFKYRKLIRNFVYHKFIIDYPLLLLK